jgi:hypothetical protein
MRFLNWIGSAIGSALDARSDLERQMAERPLLDDEAFYQLYYGSTDIPRGIPIRVRRVLGEQLGPHWLRVRPEDNIPLILDIDIAEILFEMEEEFGVKIPPQAMRSMDGSFDSVVRYIANPRYLDQSR